MTYGDGGKGQIVGKGRDVVGWGGMVCMLHVPTTTHSLTGVLVSCLAVGEGCLRQTNFFLSTSTSPSTTLTQNQLKLSSTHKTTCRPQAVHVLGKAIIIMSAHLMG